jgi:hypothetical protein
MADLSKNQSTAIERVLSQIPDKSHARQWLLYARYKTREHEKVELGAGAIFALLIGVIGLVFGGAGWGSVALAGVAFVATVILIFFWHWIHAPSAFHGYWEATSKELARKDDSENLKALGEQKRQFLGERLQALLNEAGTVEYGAISMNSIEGMGKVWRQTAYHERAKKFVKENYRPETASRYDKEKSDLLEELLADCYREKDDTKPDISGAIEQVIEKKLLPSRDAGIAGFDYYFTLRFWLRNTSAPGNFQNFALSIFVDKKVYKGEPLSLSGYCLSKQLPQQTGAHTELGRVQDELQDFDALTPLERNSSRPGWLRFVVRNVVWNQKDDAANYISRIELTVTDGSGRESVLAYKPPWSHENVNLEVAPCPAHWERLR